MLSVEKLGACRTTCLDIVGLDKKKLMAKRAEKGKRRLLISQFRESKVYVCNVLQAGLFMHMAGSVSAGAGSRLGVNKNLARNKVVE